MRRLLCCIAALIVLCTAAFAETEIQIDHVQAVAVGDTSASDLTSEGEDISSLPDPDELTEAETKSNTPDPNEPVLRLTFEKGYSISLPEGWVYYDITDEMAEEGIIYALSNADGTRRIFIQEWITNDIEDLGSLETLIRNTTTPQSSGAHEFNGTSFIVYDLPDSDISCAAALMHGKILNIMFAPQSDSAFMLTAAKIMQSFTFEN